MTRPEGSRSRPDGSILVADTENHRVVRVPRTGSGHDRRARRLLDGRRGMRTTLTVRFGNEESRAAAKRNVRFRR